MSTRIITDRPPQVEKKGYSYLVPRFYPDPVEVLERRVRDHQGIPAEASWQVYSAGGVIGEAPEDQLKQIVWTWYEVTL